MVESAARIFLGLALTATLAVPPVTTPPALRVTCAPSAEGIVAAVDFSHDMMILQTDSGTLTVQIEPRTVLNMPEPDEMTREQAEFGAVRVGDRVSVQGVCLSATTLLAESLIIDHVAAIPPAGQERTVEETVVAAEASTVSVSPQAAQPATPTGTPSTPSEGVLPPPSTAGVPPSQPGGVTPGNQPSEGTGPAGEKPGWGYGDTNQAHSGPPGKTEAGIEQEAGAGALPGWGYGDKNHTHSGPPGKSEIGDKPGWGYGDKNHVHSGPPGQTDII